MRSGIQLEVCHVLAYSTVQQIPATREVYHATTINKQKSLCMIEEWFCGGDNEGWINRISESKNGMHIGMFDAYKELKVQHSLCVSHFKAMVSKDQNMTFLLPVPKSKKIILIHLELKLRVIIEWKVAIMLNVLKDPSMCYAIQKEIKKGKTKVRLKGGQVKGRSQQCDPFIALIFNKWEEWSLWKNYEAMGIKHTQFVLEDKNVVKGKRLSGSQYLRLVSDRDADSVNIKEIQKERCSAEKDAQIASKQPITCGSLEVITNGRREGDVNCAESCRWAQFNILTGLVKG